MTFLKKINYVQHTIKKRRPVSAKLYNIIFNRRFNKLTGNCLIIPHEIILSPVVHKLKKHSNNMHATSNIQTNFST